MVTTLTPRVSVVEQKTQILKITDNLSIDLVDRRPEMSTQYCRYTAVEAGDEVTTQFHSGKFRKYFPRKILKYVRIWKTLYKSGN